MKKKFDWTGWDRFDTYSSLDKNNCNDEIISSDTSGTSGTSGGPLVLTGCAAGMPPRIDSFNILKSSIIEMRITNWQ